MKNLTNYIVFHSQESFDLFQENNKHINTKKFFYVYVGRYWMELKGDKINDYKILFAGAFLHEIEKMRSLLSFTWWYVLAKNILTTKSDYVGIFEYDVKFSHEIDIKLKKNTIYGINKRLLPDAMFLKSLPLLNSLMKFDERKIKHWNSSSNFIMPMEFLIKFVDWYMGIVPEIIIENNHSHYHERAVNIFAANNGYQNETIEGIEHLQLNSHGINL